MATNDVFLGAGKGGIVFGSLRGGAPHEFARVIWPERPGAPRQFEGEFHRGVKHGEGTYELLPDAVYHGQFDNDVRHGLGRQTFANGGSVTAEFVHGHIDGHGIMQLDSGVIYDGEFVDSKPNGHGTIKSVDGSIYVGNFVNGIRQGHGKTTWPNGETYEGTYEDDTRHGFGTYTWPDGRMYRGQFVKGQRHGRGEFQWPNGDRFEGQYQKDVWWGPGKLFKGGEVDEGEWQGSKLVALSHNVSNPGPHTRAARELIETCKSGNVARVEELLAMSSIYPNLESDTGSYPLHEATSHSHLQIVRLLVKAGAHLNKKNRRGHTPLFELCHLQGERLTKIQAQYRARRLAKQQLREQQKQEKARKRIEELRAAEAAEAEARKNMTPRVRISSLGSGHASAVASRSASMVFVPVPATPSGSGKGSRARPARSVRSGNGRSVTPYGLDDDMAEEDEDDNDDDEEEVFSCDLFEMDQSGFKTLELLLSLGADPNIVCNEGTVLQTAVQAGDSKLTDTLLRAGANPNMLDPQSGMTMLHLAVSQLASSMTMKKFRAEDEENAERRPSSTRLSVLSPSLRVMLLLLNAGANVNAESRDGHRPLHEACLYPGIEAYIGACTLLSRGASVSAVWKHQTPLSLAIRTGNDSTTQILLEHGANPNATCEIVAGVFGTMLQAVVLGAMSGQRQLKLLDLLLSFGADPYACVPIVGLPENAFGTSLDQAHVKFITQNALHSKNRLTLTAEERIQFENERSVVRLLLNGARAWRKTKGIGEIKLCDECGLSIGKTLVSCSNCQKVFFCSERCRIRAYNTYHRKECVAAPVLEAAPMKQVIQNLNRLNTTKGQVHWVPGQIWETGAGVLPQPPFMSKPGLLGRELEWNAAPVTRAEMFATRLRNTSMVAPQRLPKLAHQQTKADAPPPAPVAKEDIKESFSLLKQFRKGKKQ